MKKEIYINGECVAVDKADIQVLERYFKIVEEDRVFETNDLDDVHQISGRKVFTDSNEMVDFIMFLESNGLDSVIKKSSTSPCKIIGIQKKAKYSKEKLEDLHIPWMLFYNNNYSDDLVVFSLDDMLDLSIQEVNSYNWIFDIEWKRNNARGPIYNDLVHYITDVIRKYNIPYSSTSKKRITALKTRYKK